MNLLFSRSFHWIVPLLVLGSAIMIGFGGPGTFADAIRLLTKAIFGDLILSYPVSELARPVFARDVELAFLAAAGLVVIGFFGRGRPSMAALATLAAGMVAALLSWRIAAEAQTYFDAGYIACALLAVFFAGLCTRSLNIVLGRGQVRRSLLPHLAHSALETVSERPELLRLQGQRKTVSYLVCSIRDYAAIADAYAADVPALSALTRRIMTPIVQAVLEKGGTIDHLFAGGLSAFFNAPLDDAEHGIHACECALRMRDELENINRVFEHDRRPDGKSIAPIELCIGINTGECAIGNFGTRSRSEYSVAGRAVEFARELSYLSSKYGPAAIVGDETRALAERNFAYLEVDTLPNGPKDAPAQIFALLGSAVLRASPKFRALQTFHFHIMKAYRAREWERARKLIEQCRALSGSNLVLYRLYEERIAFLERHPPQEDWSGVFRPPQT